MEKTQFYLWLPSNSSLDVFPENTLAEYRVQLPQTIKLVDEWEVAITEFQYPHTWNNVHNNSHWNRFYIKKGFPIEGYTIPPGHHPSIEEIVKTMNKLVTDSIHKGSVSFSFDKLSRKVTINIRNNVKVAFADVGEMLGFKKDDWYSTTTTGLPDYRYVRSVPGLLFRITAKSR